jgi:large subunit ribosomal protein L19
VKRTGRVRRAKLYYLRDRVGKATRLRERRSKPSADGAAKKGAAQAAAEQPKT